MKLSAQEEYGLRCLIQIGHKTPLGGTTISEISKAESLSVSNAAKLVRILRMNGFVSSSRGKDGGYSLARPADEIFLSDVLDVLGGKLFGAGFCDHYSGTRGVCAHFDSCAVRSFWCAIQSVLDHVLGQTTLKDLLEPDDLSWWQTCLTANPIMNSKNSN